MDEIDCQVEDRENVLQLKLDGRKSFYLKKVSEALRKKEEGTFGICQECHGQIEHNRLLARPTASLCINCKEEEERNENHIPYNRKSHTLGVGLNNSHVANISVSEEDNIMEEKFLNFNKSKLEMDNLIDL